MWQMVAWEDKQNGNKNKAFVGLLVTTRLKIVGHESSENLENIDDLANITNCCLL